MSMNPYTVLGLPPGAGEDDVKKKYRALVKQYHPDLHPDDPEAARKMSEINAAYEQIKSGEYSSYSRSGSGSQSEDAGSFYGGFADTADFLNSFFQSFGFATGASEMDDSEIYRKVEIHIDSGNYDSAASILSRIIERDGRWYYYSAKLSEAVGNYTEAVRYADAAVASDRSDPYFAELAAGLHRKYDGAIRRGRTAPTLLSAISLLLAALYILRIIFLLFGWMFFL